MSDSVAKQACSENAQLPGVTYTYICANKTNGQRSTYPIWNNDCGLYRAQFLQRMPDRKKKRPDSTGKTPYWKLQRLRTYKSFRWIWPHMYAPSAIRSRKIFNTGCKDAKRQRNWDLIFLVKTQEDWFAWQSTLYRQWPWRGELSPQDHNKIFISSGNFTILSFVSFFYLLKS